jgi:hypothetical protein
MIYLPITIGTVLLALWLTGRMYDRTEAAIAPKEISPP